MRQIGRDGPNEVEGFGEHEIWGAAWGMHGWNLINVDTTLSNILAMVVWGGLMSEGPCVEDASNIKLYVEYG